MTTLTPPNFVDDERYESAPRMPTDRPPTKFEVRDYWFHILDGVKAEDEITSFCRQSWAWAYVAAVNFKRWGKHPDWLPGDPVIHEAVPAKPFLSGSNYAQAVEDLWQIARRIKKERFGT